MQEICSFVINNRIYTIYDVDRIKGRENYTGRSDYSNRTIFIEKTDYDTMLIILKHELMHVWLYENGYEYQTKECNFNFEELCELVALSNDSINRIVKLYLDSKNI